MATPLPSIDRLRAATFWQGGIDAGAIPAGTPLPTSIGPFGDSVELADELIALVLSGRKRATCGAVAEYEHDGEQLPGTGTWSIATDGFGRARAALRTTGVGRGPMSSVTDAFAWDEGEDDRTRAGWLAAHTRYFRRVLPTLGVAFDPDIEVVFERFVVDYQA